ncbi:MAG: hypothetical protein ACLFPJ_02610 [Candidatus Woesearchaeota archaeon]
MFKLKEAKGTYKGLIGECMFKLTRKYAILNKYWNKRKYFEIFGKYLNDKQINFLNKYWHSLDAIEIVFINKTKNVFLYEIKTKNIYNKSLGFKPKITKSSVLLYKKAIELDFKVNLAFVCFYNDWNYSVKIVDFSENNYYIDSKKLYDKKELY